MIVDKNIRNIRLALFDKNITINLSDNAKKWFINKSSLENAGGRPVERIINTEISEKIADEILFGTLSENGGKVNVDEKDDKIVLNFN
jgi:ATP-dependent Clp protease ATP-binding subunit ClpA